MLLKTVRLFIKILDWYLPRENGFDTSFMIEVLRGKKKYLPLSVSSGFDLSYFRKGETLTKNYIINKMMENNVYSDYVPDGVDFTKLSRKFLLSVSILNFIFIITYSL